MGADQGHVEQAQKHPEGSHLGGDRHERRHRRRRALVDIRRPLVKRRHRRLEAQAHHAQPDAGQRQRIGREAPVRAERACDRAEVGRSGGAVDQRKAIEQRRRADRAHDQVLQAGLQRALAPHFGGAQHVQRDRQELEPQEQRHRVLGRRQQRHATDRGQQQGVPLAVGRFARGFRAPGEQHRARAARHQDQIEHQRQAVDAQRPRHHRLLGAPLPDRQARRRGESHQAERRHDVFADPPRTDQADQQHDHRAAEQRDQRRQRGEVHVRAFERGEGEGRAHLPAPAPLASASLAGCPPSPPVVIGCPSPLDRFAASAGAGAYSA